jgi:phosphatidylglycerophosphatase GEP4
MLPLFLITLNYHYLSHTYIDQLHPSVVSTVDDVKKLFPGAVAILSNSVGSCDDPDYRAAAETEKHMNIPVIRHKLKKPACLAEVLAHFESRLGRSVQPSEIAMIGDRVLTDVMFGNVYGMLSVLVGPLSLRHDHPIAVIIRFLETKILLPLLRFFGVRKRGHRSDYQK